MTIVVSYEVLIFLLCSLFSLLPFPILPLTANLSRL